MHRIAIVGAGQLGSRHLQGLARLPMPCEIWVVDPSAAALQTARERCTEMPANAALGAVHYQTSIDGLPDSLDYAIVATSADVRLQVLRALLGMRSVRFLLLEKVLFQHVDEYAQAASLLAAHGVQAWVNCTRRIFPIYAWVKEFFAVETLRSFQVAGGGWGLGCNAIHFLDVLGMLTAAVPSEMTAEGLDPALVPSKRANFLEFTGTLRGRCGATRFEVTSYAESQARLLVTLRSEHRFCLLDETAGNAFVFDGRWAQKDFRLPLTSEAGTAIAERILTAGTSDLPTFEQSCSYHLPLIQTLAAHAHANHGTPVGFCPVT
jgi:predicted dehydrogenase